MNALPLIIVALCVMAIAYRYYSAFIAAKVVALDDARITPAHTLNDGQNYIPTNKWVLFGHHFAAISGRGPADRARSWRPSSDSCPASSGWWSASCSPGRCTISRSSSPRSGEGAVARGDRPERDQPAGRHRSASIAILIILVIALAGLGLAVVNALARKLLGDVHDRHDDPHRALRRALDVPDPPGEDRGGERHRRRRVIVLCVLLGSMVPGSFLAPYFTLSREGIVIAMAVYGFVASVLPVWLLLVPARLPELVHEDRDDRRAGGRRDRRPPRPEDARASRSTSTAAGRSFAGKLFPFLFVTIACGAISGFHALVSSGTTPKMINKESRRPVYRVRRDADGRACRDHRADRGLLAPSRRIISPSTFRPRNSRRSGMAPVNLARAFTGSGGKRRRQAGRRGLAGGRVRPDLHRDPGADRASCRSGITLPSCSRPCSS